MDFPGKEQYAPVEISEAVEPTTLPSVSAKRCVEVVAPSKLMGGYRFDVQIDGKTCTIEVPDGGVEQGQHFIATVVAEDYRTNSGSTSHNAKYSPDRMNIPVGHWRDGLCDCFIHGICHPMCCLVFWCYPIVLGQIMTRLSLSWTADVKPLSKKGHSSNSGAGISTFKIILGITVVFVSIDQFLASVSAALKTSWLNHEKKLGNPIIEGEVPPSVLVTDGLRLSWEFVFWVFFMYVAIKTRSYIRHKYAIPEQNCEGCEDFCCVLWCHWCTACQMARHTADYDVYRSGLCTETGLPIDAPEIV